ncbi:S-adenosyl-L-methionine-dependent methyltransferase,Lysine methyltransferase [Cinara cedri]|uniref:protein-histidine N-methyltransferase n=1 Tax=Cinara cedri TaxID=506608 RepID=A0A5E4NGZ1_9HEMI|nr:S-adenosyl-L-methionine-dependent methyltransferase,Lysine methyltransferase [Cinara cedri]
MFKFNFNAEDSPKSHSCENEYEVVKTEELSTPNTLITKSFTNLTIRDRSLKLVNEFPSIYNSDLIPGTYEGGFKLWECTIDLLEYLSNNSVFFNGKSVLDLGCGTGLLGIFTLVSGAQNVDFQDFNKDVLINTTMSNVLLNCEDKLNVCKYYSGDWKSFTDFNENKYDLILTSETIYNVNNYKKLINLFEKKLKLSGCILLIAKNYYFGVGGSISEFIHFLKSSKLNSDIVWESTDGVKKTLLNIHF